VKIKIKISRDELKLKTLKKDLKSAIRSLPEKRSSDALPEILKELKKQSFFQFQEMGLLTALSRQDPPWVSAIILP
jgi:hypothetical protein